MRLIDHLEKLPYFVTVAQLGSFQAAAEVLNLTQPTLSKSIKILEEQLGKAFFIRHAKGVQLTQDGEILLREGIKILSLAEQAIKILENPGDPFADHLRIGTYDSILIYFWADFLKKFSIRHPKLEFEIKTMRSSDVQRSLLSDELDFALIISPSPADELELITLQSDCFYFFESTAIDRCYKSYKAAPLIYMVEAFSGHQDIFSQVIFSHSKDGQAKKTYQVSSLESVKELCMKGLGIGILPHFVAKKEIKSKKLRKINYTGTHLDKGFGEHNISVIYKKRWSQSQTIQDLTAQLLLHQWS
jgi:DNA-binding transcriptional LysR family regulator